MEVISPRNSTAEIREKMALYFDAGASEVWTCSKAGKMNFFGKIQTRSLGKSVIVPDFPRAVRLS